MSFTKRLLKIVLPLENESSMCALRNLFVICRIRDGDSSCQRRAYRGSGL